MLNLQNQNCTGDRMWWLAKVERCRYDAGWMRSWMLVLLEYDARLVDDWMPAPAEYDETGRPLLEYDAKLDVRFAEYDAKLDARFADHDAKLDSRFATTT